MSDELDEPPEALEMEIVLSGDRTVRVNLDGICVLRFKASSQFNLVVNDHHNHEWIINEEGILN